MGQVGGGGCHASSAILSFKLPVSRLRWIAVGVFVLSSSLNYFDRNLLAALAPAIKDEFHIDDEGFGYLIAVFSLPYALSSPLAGAALDRFGLNRVSMILVAAWSAVSALTGMTRNYVQLIACRVALGVSESGGIPAVAKMGANYLPPEQRALGSALGQIGLTIGGMLAPLVGVGLAVKYGYGWRFPFLITAVFGLLWLPLWWYVSRRIQPFAVSEPLAHDPGVPLDRNLVLLVIANVMWMSSYSLWSNWTTLYLQRVHHLSLGQTAAYAWVPPVASNLGGFLGGWLALRWIGGGNAAISARVRVVLLGALGGLFTLLVPIAPSPAWGIAAISLSYFWTLAGSVNIYTLPVDLYGPGRAGRAIAALVFAYGLLQTVISPLIGKMVKTSGYGPVCWMVALPPLAAWLILRFGLPKSNFLARST